MRFILTILLFLATTDAYAKYVAFGKGATVSNILVKEGFAGQLYRKGLVKTICAVNPTIVDRECRLKVSHGSLYLPDFIFEQKVVEKVVVKETVREVINTETVQVEVPVERVVTITVPSKTPPKAEFFFIAGLVQAPSEPQITFQNNSITASSKSTLQLSLGGGAILPNGLGAQGRVQTTGKQTFLGVDIIYVLGRGQ